MNITPPLCLRHITPWWILYWLDEHTNVCWAGVVMWKMGHDGWSWWPAMSCWEGPGFGHDFCGKWRERRDFLPHVREDEERLYYIGPRR